MLNSVIIEDEKPSARRLHRMLNKLELHVETTLHSVEDAMAWFSNNPHPDLIFLDIQLSDGLSFEIFDTVEIDSAIIFTTAYDEYALRAFKLNSIDYLLKPIDDEELEAAIAKFRNNYGEAKSGLDLKDLKSLLNFPVQEFKKRFTVQVGQHLKIISVDDISCFFSQNKSTFIICQDGRSYPVDFSLDSLDDQLNSERFFRINRHCILNMNAIKDIVSYTNSRLEIKIGQRLDEPLIVSRERVKEFKNWLS